MARVAVAARARTGVRFFDTITLLICCSFCRIGGRLQGWPLVVQAARFEAKQRLKTLHRSLAGMSAVLLPVRDGHSRNTSQVGQLRLAPAPRFSMSADDSSYRHWQPPVRSHERIIIPDRCDIFRWIASHHVAVIRSKALYHVVAIRPRTHDGRRHRSAAVVCAVQRGRLTARAGQRSKERTNPCNPSRRRPSSAPVPAR